MNSHQRSKLYASLVKRGFVCTSWTEVLQTERAWKEVLRTGRRRTAYEQGKRWYRKRGRCVGYTFPCGIDLDEDEKDVCKECEAREVADREHFVAWCKSHPGHSQYILVDYGGRD